MHSLSVRRSGPKRPDIELVVDDPIEFITPVVGPHIESWTELTTITDSIAADGQLNEAQEQSSPPIRTSILGRTVVALTIPGVIVGGYNYITTGSLAKAVAIGFGTSVGTAIGDSIQKRR